jgi:hypothetical protein
VIVLWLRSLRSVPSTASPRRAPKLRPVCVMPVTSLEFELGARLTASVLAGPRINPSPAPAIAMESRWSASDGSVTLPASRSGEAAPRLSCAALAG